VGGPGSAGSSLVSISVILLYGVCHSIDSPKCKSYLFDVKWNLHDNLAKFTYSAFMALRRFEAGTP